jgi:hypothetical protein
MEHDENSGAGFTPGDIQALRYLAIALGIVVGVFWLVFEDLSARLLMTGLCVVMLLGGLLAVYLYRRLRRRK